MIAKKTIISTQYNHFFDQGNLITYKTVLKNNMNMYLRYNATDKIFVVTCNKYASKKIIETFVLTHYQKFLINESKKEPADDNVIKIFDIAYQIKIIKSKTNKSEFLNSILYLKLTSLDKRKITIKKYIQKTYGNYLITRTFLLAKKVGLEVSSVDTKWFSNRWGHCMKRNKSIALSLQLIQYPVDTIDAIIYHELAHLVYFDHQSNFKKLWLEFCPNYKQALVVLDHHHDY